MIGKLPQVFFIYQTSVMAFVATVGQILLQYFLPRKYPYDPFPNFLWPRTASVVLLWQPKISGG